MRCYHRRAGCRSGPSARFKESNDLAGQALGALIGAVVGRRRAAFGARHRASVRSRSSTDERAPAQRGGADAHGAAGSVFPRDVPGHGPSRQGGRAGLRGRDPRGARDHERVPPGRARSAARDRAVHAGQAPRLPARADAARAAPALSDGVPTCAACSCRSSCRRRCGAAVSTPRAARCWRGSARRSASRRYEVVQMEALLRMQQAQRVSRSQRRAVDRVAEAYEVLGVSAHGDRRRGDQGLSAPDEPESSRQAGRERPAGVDDEGRRREDAPDPRRLRAAARRARHEMSGGAQ